MGNPKETGPYVGQYQPLAQGINELPPQRAQRRLNCVNCTLIVLSSFAILYLLGLIEPGQCIPSKFRNDIVTPHRTVFDVLTSEPRFQSFIELVQKHSKKNLRDEFGDMTRTMTLFVPTNEAFEHDDFLRDLKREGKIDDVLKYLTLDHDFPLTSARTGLKDSSLRLHSLDDKLQKLYISVLLKDEHNDRVERLLGRGRSTGDDEDDDSTITEDFNDEKHRHRKHKNRHSHETTVRVNDFVQIEEGDILAVNGRIHAISSFARPPSNLLHTMNEFPMEFSTTLVAIQKSGLLEDEQLLERQKRAITGFLPENKAWTKLEDDKRMFLFSPEGRELLKQILQYHFLPNLVYDTDVPGGRGCHYMETLLKGNEVCVKRADVQDQKRRHKHKHRDQKKKRETHPITVDENTNVVFEDLLASDGVGHIIDRVLVPPNLEEGLQQEIQRWLMNGKNGASEKN